MGNSSSSNRTVPPSVDPLVKSEEIKSEENPRETIPEQPVVIVEEMVEQEEETTVVVEEPAVEALTQAFEKTVVIEEKPGEFSIAGKALKLDTAEDVTSICDEIKSIKHLQKVSFVGNTLGIEASKAIAEALDTQSELRDVDFSDCFTGRLKEEVPVSVAAFGTVLATKLLLERVNFSDNAFGPIGAKALVQLLSQSPCLQELVLNNNGLGPEGGRIIAEALIESVKIRTRPLLKVLIGRNRLENGSSAAFAKMLESHIDIEDFALPQCGIRSEGIVTLSSGLSKCRGLVSVDLQDNTFTTNGAKAFAEAFNSWKALKSLNVGDCMCEAEGSTILMKALVDSSIVEYLETFNFQYNEMDEEGAKILADNLDKFKALKSLMLNGNAFNPVGSAADKIKETVSSDILDEWSDMEYDSDDDASETGSEFITEKERSELVVESEEENESDLSEPKKE